jgi:parallel beta-helix repeat protein
VSPSGNDSNPGTLAKPFATVQRARDAVRKLNRSAKGNINVLIHKGTYYLRKPIALDERDSGFNGHYVIYRGYKNECPKIIGGVPVKGWKPYKNGIFRAQVGKDVMFWSLLVDGELADIAKCRGRKPKNFKQLSIRNLQAYFQGSWMAEYLKVSGFDEQGNATFEFKRSRHAKGGPTLLGAVQFIDKPGEWALDSNAGDLYLLPKKPEDLKNVVRPTVKAIFQCRGSSRDKRIENVVIKGLELVLTDFNATMRCYSGIVENGYEYLNLDRANTLRTALVAIENARGIQVLECQLSRAPIDAVSIYGPAEKNAVKGCKITSIGYNGIYLAGYKLTKDYTADENKNNVVSNNEISDIMRTVNHASGILIYQSSGNQITYNMIHNSRRYGISMKGARYRKFKSIGLENVTFEDQWKYLHSNKNVIAFNYMYNLGADSSDGGGVETWGAGRDNIIDHNIIFDAYIGKPKGGWRGHAIFLDDGANYWTTTNNVVWNTRTPAANADANIKGIGMRTSNNVFDISLCQHGAANMQAYAEKSDDQWFMRNIVYSNGKNDILEDGRPSGKAPESLRLFTAKPWQIMTKCDYNLYFTSGVPMVVEVAKGCRKKDKATFLSFDEWKKFGDKGYDAHSKVADPKFKNVAERDYRLRVDSPAWKMGMKSIDMGSIGLLPSYPFADKKDSLKLVFLKHGGNDVFTVAKPGSKFKLSISGRTMKWYAADLSKATVKYASDNPSVATVDSKGAVSVKGKGKATITATVQLNGAVKKDDIVVFSGVPAPTAGAR